MEDVLRVNAICKRAQDAENRLMEQTVEELVKQLEEITVEADASEVR